MIATLFFLHIQQKFQNLVLDRHIQHRYNLIHNQETQPEQQRPDNGNALQLTTKNSAGPYFKPKNKPQRAFAPELTKKGRISISLFFGTTLIMSSRPALIHCRKNFILFLRSLHHRKSISKFLRIPYRPLPWPGRHSGSCRHRDHSRRRKRETAPHRFHRFLSFLW